MNKLTAAIDILRELNGPADTITEQGKYDDAIRILEAAEKVDRDNAEWNLEEAFSHGREHVEMMAPYKEDHNLGNYNRAEQEITALIESLPEPDRIEINRRNE